MAERPVSDRADGLFQEEGLCPSHPCLTHPSPPLLAVASPLRGPDMETVLRGGGQGGGTPASTCPEARARPPGRKPLCLSVTASLQAGGPLSDQAPKVNTWCRVFPLHFPLNLCARPLLASTPSACLLQPCGRHAWGLKMPFICIQVCVGFFVYKLWQLPQSSPSAWG